MGIFLVCSKVCSDRFAFIRVDRRMHKCWPNPRNFDPKTSTTHPELELDHVSGIVSENRVINRAIGLYFVLATMSHPFFGFSASGLGNTTNIKKAIFYKISRYGASHSSQNHPPCQPN